MRPPANRSVLLLLLAAPFLFSAAQPFDYPAANLSAHWTNSPSLPHSVTYPDGSTIRAVLLRGSFGPSFALGFFCNAPCDAFLLAIFIVYTNSGSQITLPTLAAPQVVWSANRDRPVGNNATLNFSQTGDLELSDANGTLVWSTNTTGRSVVGMNLTDAGNLMLVDSNNASVWASFDHPTDSLVLGQTLSQGQRLTANVSATNSTQGQLYITVLTDGLYAFVDSKPPQLYYQFGIRGTKTGNKPSYIAFVNGTLQLFVLFTQTGVPDITIPLPQASSVQYMRLESDGHFRIYEWATGWKLLGDVFSATSLDGCAYPTVCGEYGICSNGQCSCPNGTYFQQVNERQANLGCYPVTPIACQSIQNHQFLALENTSYFNYIDNNAVVLQRTNEESCKQACLRNCSCKAALFQYGGNASGGSCYLPSQLFSLMNNQPTVTHYNSTAYIKVQITPTAPSPALNGSVSAPSPTKKESFGIILGSILAALLVISLVIGIIIVFLRRKRAKEMEEEEDFDQLPGMPTRFSFEQLKVATDDFNIKLGEGGFGSVFEGTLGDGMRVAVKRLDRIGQGKKEFLAEVVTIGSIHHINLVRLVGFCAEKSYRLLVYEYMSNGSLEKWIFDENQKAALDWSTRHKIIIDIAKGLSYLHEECRQIIAHLDIKPQNILLDDKFNAKVSDFGLSKLIDRDKSLVMTRMRGTPGYLAPEWLTSIITEKVDVYSFGVVVMEIVCGRKNVDNSQPEERVHLIGLLHDMVKFDRLIDLVDHHINLQSNMKEILRMMELSMWCLQSDASRRPSMSMVVKFLEGAMDVDTSLDYDFSTTPTSVISHKANCLGPSAPLLPSILSGPR